jgi:hypothetical protein
MVIRRVAVVERIEDALVASGASIVTHADPRSAPFEITIRTPTGETLDLVCYAFAANGYRRLVSDRIEQNLSRGTLPTPPGRHSLEIQLGLPASVILDVAMARIGRS